MTRVRRILLNAATALSLLLFLVAAAAWPTGYRWSVDFRWNDQSHLRGVASQHGALYLWLWGGEMQYVPIAGFRVEDARLLPRLETVYTEGDARTFKPIRILRATAWQGEFRIYAVADWLVIAVAALLPVGRLRSRLRRRDRDRKRAAGLCPACGYDLRATPERCPECGRDVA